MIDPLEPLLQNLGQRPLAVFLLVTQPHGVPHMPKNRLFVALLVLESTIADRDRDSLVDHQVRLIRAPNAKAAYDRALRLGETETAAYKTGEGEIVRWQFLGLSDLYRLDERQLQDGGEVFSWRTQGSGHEFVKQRDQLSVFAPKP